MSFLRARIRHVDGDPVAECELDLAGVPDVARKGVEWPFARLGLLTRYAEAANDIYRRHALVDLQVCRRAHSSAGGNETTTRGRPTVASVWAEPMGGVSSPSARGGQHFMESCLNIQ